MMNLLPQPGQYAEQEEPAKRINGLVGLLMGHLPPAQPTDPQIMERRFQNNVSELLPIPITPFNRPMTTVDVRAFSDGGRLAAAHFQTANHQHSFSAIASGIYVQLPECPPLSMVFTNVASPEYYYNGLAFSSVEAIGQLAVVEESLLERLEPYNQKARPKLWVVPDVE